MTQLVAPNIILQINENEIYLGESNTARPVIRHTIGTHPANVMKAGLAEEENVTTYYKKVLNSLAI